MNLEKEINIGEKFVCTSVNEYISISKELAERGYEFETKFMPRLFEKTWVIRVVGFKAKETTIK